MSRRLLAASILALTIATPAAAATTFTVTFGASPITYSNNDFGGGLGGLSPALTKYVAEGASLALTGPGIVDFYYIGAESGYTNKFTATNGLQPAVTKTESNESLFGLPLPPIGSLTYASGGTILASSWIFTSNQSGIGGLGRAANIGQNGFGFFVPGNAVGSYSNISTIYFGYDDQQFSGDDDNHDDLVMYATVRALPPVPEPATWAMMISGFGAVGAAMRRRGAKRLQAA